MGKLRYTIEDKAIAELFGRQNFTTKESAIFELVKNSYDSGSTTCLVSITDSSIIIQDSGKGMDKHDIITNWMHVGKSEKGYKDVDTQRVLAGSKGVGRFAIARIGGYSEITSKKHLSHPVLWKTNWDNTELEEIEYLQSNGTIIKITELRDKWKQRDINQLVDFLNRAYCDSSMKISIDFNQTKYLVSPILYDLKLGENYVTQIEISYDCKTCILTTEIISDEFEDTVAKMTKVNIKYFKIENDIRKIFETEIKQENISSDMLTELGNFSGKFYFSLDTITKDIKQRFLYKHMKLKNRIDTGIILYRNAFSISSLEGKKDWLGLNYRVRKSPAAATHPTGSWRVRANQLSGRVNIDKLENKRLEDLSNRQGLDENAYYELFIKIIQQGILEFERYRQSIIRDINNFNINKDNTKQKEYQEIKKFLKKPHNVKKLPTKSIENLASEIVEIQKEIKNVAKSSKETEEKFRYESRILNVLATQGLKASGIAHELHTDRTDLDQGYHMIESNLRRLGMWEILNSEENTKIASRNVPEILKRLEKTNRKLKQFLDIMLGRIAKNSFQETISSLDSSFEKLCENWKSDYAYLEINIRGKESGTENYILSEDIFSVIFDNLILNSIQCNPTLEKLIIHIDYAVQNEFIVFEYRDNGVGLTGIYKENPRLTLEVHESSREEGHGLGMWIINNSLLSLDGHITQIENVNENGYKINFFLKGVATINESN
ncbi:ATP-binding protein [Enterococcus faecalis]|nr:ATP-binding protein [Enterococcus faecalis]